MRLLIAFARAYPWHSAVTLFALALAGIVEGFGLTALLPLLSAAVNSQAPAEQGAAASASTVGQMVTDALLAMGLTPTVGVLLAVVVSAILLKSGLVLLANKRVGYTVAHVATDLRLALFRALLVTRWEYYLSQPVGGLANAVATEAMRAANAYLCGARMSALLIQAIVYAGVAFLVSWKATLISLAAGMIILYMLNRLVRKAKRAGERQTTLLRSLLARLTDSLQSIKPLKAMAREKMADSLLTRETTRLNKALRKQVFSKEALRASQEPLLTTFLAIGLYVALVLWNLPLATVMVLVFLLARLLNQLGKVQRQYQHMVICESAYWSLKDTIRDAEGERETVSGSQLPSLNHAIQLDRVSFTYGEHQVLRNASLTIPAGRFTSIVGPSGAGKTTVADLVTGLLRPQEGEILIDDLPLEEADLRGWRQLIGYVPQEPILLHDTVLINVTLGDAGLTEEDVERALRAAGAWEFVVAMPHGMHSTVGERGGKLSGGQRQRIAMARALIHKPKLLILDEPTSALDHESEAAICSTLRQLRGEFTILAISHQPALLEVADRAYHLQDGRAVLVTQRSAAVSSYSGEINSDSNFKLPAAANPITRT